MSYVFDLGKPVGEFGSTGGKQFPKPFHAYRAKLGMVTSENGWIKIPVEGVDYEAGQYDALSCKETSDWLQNWVGKLAKAVADSNPKLAAAGMLSATKVDATKWNGLEVGVVYKVKQVKDGNGVWVDGKFCEPHYVIPVGDVDSFTPDQKKYDEWYTKHWGNKSVTSTATAPSATQNGDDDTLPF